MEEMIYTGIRLTAEQCVEYNIVRKAYPIEQLMEKTMTFAKSLNKNRAYVKETPKPQNPSLMKIIF